MSSELLLYRWIFKVFAFFLGLMTLALVCGGCRTQQATRTVATIHSGKVQPKTLYVCLLVDVDQEPSFECITAEAYMDAMKQPQAGDVTL